MWRPLLLSLPLLFAQSLAALPHITAKGAKFFTSDGAQFFIKGVAYQNNEQDTLLDPGQCKLDAALMKTLGTNSVRVYHVHSSKNHDGCMKAFEDAGIYVWLDLDTYSDFILPNTGNNPTWTQAKMNKYSDTMDAFANYNNIAGFFVGNEMLTTGESSIAAPYVKAAAHDMKAYRDSKGYRQFPIGYSAADIPDLRPNLQNYLACGDSADAVDFYSLNAYEWCGDSSYDESGYDELQKNASGYNIPIFFSETGCNVTPRLFSDQAAIFGKDMVDTWSGALIFEWKQVENNYGVISYPDGGISGQPTPLQPDFENLSSQWATLKPTGTSAAAYTPTAKAPACPTYDSQTWKVHGDVPLPTLKAAAATNTGTSGSSTSGAGRLTAFGVIELWFQHASQHPALYWVFGCILAVVGPAMVL